MLQDFKDITLQSQSQFSQFNVKSYLQLVYIDQFKAAQNHILQQLYQISEQNDLIRQIKEKITSRGSSKDDETLGEEQETVDLHSSRIFSMSNNSRTHLFESKVHFQTEMGLEESSKPTKRVLMSPSQHLEMALTQIEQRCQRSTCEAISQLLREAADKSATVRALQCSISRLETETLILKERLEHQTRHVLSLEEKLKGLENDISTKAKALNEKDQKLLKLQTSLVIREEMLARETKKLKAKGQYLRDRENQLALERQQLDSTWEQLLSKLETKDDVFRAQVYSRCKDSLVKQRKILAEEQQALELQHETIKKMVAQFKEHGAL